MNQVLLHPTHVHKVGPAMLLRRHPATSGDPTAAIAAAESQPSIIPSAGTPAGRTTPSPLPTPPAAPTPASKPPKTPAHCAAPTSEPPAGLACPTPSPLYAPATTGGLPTAPLTSLSIGPAAAVEPVPVTTPLIRRAPSC